MFLFFCASAFAQLTPEERLQRAEHLAESLRTSYMSNWLIHQGTMTLWWSVDLYYAYRTYLPFQTWPTDFAYERLAPSIWPRPVPWLRWTPKVGPSYYAWRLKSIEELGKLGIDTPEVNQSLLEVAKSANDIVTRLAVAEAFAAIHTSHPESLRYLIDTVRSRERSYYEAVNKLENGTGYFPQWLDRASSILDSWFPDNFSEHVVLQVEGYLRALTQATPNDEIRQLQLRWFVLYFASLSADLKIEMAKQLTSDPRFAEALKQQTTGRAEITTFLATFGHDEALEPKDNKELAMALVEEFSSSRTRDAFWRRYAIEQIGMLGVSTSETNELLVDVLQNERDAEIRDRAAHALGQIHTNDPLAIQVLARELHQEYRHFLRSPQERTRNGEFRFPKDREDSLQRVLFYANALANTRYHDDRPLDLLINIVAYFGNEIPLALRLQLLSGIYVGDDSAQERVLRFANQRFQWLVGDRPRRLLRETYPRDYEGTAVELSYLVRTLATSDQSFKVLHMAHYLVVNHWELLDEVSKRVLVSLFFKHKTEDPLSYKVIEERARSHSELGGYFGLDLFAASPEDSLVVISAFQFEHSEDPALRFIAENILTAMRAEPSRYEDILIGMLTLNNPHHLRAANELKRFNPAEPSSLNRILRRMIGNLEAQKIMNRVLNSHLPECERRLLGENF